MNRLHKKIITLLCIGVTSTSIIQPMQMHNVSMSIAPYHAAPQASLYGVSGITGAACLYTGIQAFRVASRRALGAVMPVNPQVQAPNIQAQNEQSFMVLAATSIVTGLMSYVAFVNAI